MIGQTLGHYRVVEKIGAGGMGEVYRARDEHLDRDVALKVLPVGALVDEAARKRFRKEALALSKLNHPNIATIHDFDTRDGLDFLVMELVPGEALNEKLKLGPLKEKEILRLGLQLAEGLAAAQAQGVVHRDIKPGNLLITPEGHLKILDFGLAKLLQPSADPDVTRSLSETRSVAGTLPYMSPEQLQGESLDARSDLYVAGAVLYEMATGRRPFEEKLSTALVNDIIHKLPPPPGRLNPALSPKLEDIILKCLEKEADNRYQSARELVVDLRNAGTRSTAEAIQPAAQPKASWRRLGLGAGIAVVMLAGILLVLNTSHWRERVLGRSARSRIESLAVLPLENLSRDPEQEYFADGMTEALITELSKIGALKVISRTSVMRYRNTDKPMPQIARDLGVDGLIEGSVLREGDQVRITVQLIEGKSDLHLWAESYQREMHSILALQSEVARDISREIKAKVSPEEQARLLKTRSVDPEAHRLTLLGRYYWNKRNAKDLRAAIDYFEKAIAQDPTYAPAYAGLADCYAVMVIHSDVRPKETFPKAAAVANKALEIDDTLAGPHAALAWTKDEYEWDWAGAEREYMRALELNPNYATAHQWYALHFAFLGRIDEAITEMKRAQELDPLSLIITTNLGQLLYMARRYDAAIEQYRKTLDMDPNFVHAHSVLGSVYREQGRYEEAIAEYKKAVELSGSSTLRLAGLGNVYGRAGKRADALKVIGQLKELSTRTYVDPIQMAIVYAGLGEKDQVFAWLERAFEERSLTQFFLKADPGFDPLRSDPRFQDLLRRIGLPP